MLVIYDSNFVEESVIERQDSELDTFRINKCAMRIISSSSIISDSDFSRVSLAPTTAMIT
jgi:hypothetical protein